LDISFLVLFIETQAVYPPSNFHCSKNLDNPQQTQNNEDHYNDNQNMNPAACLREAWTDVPTKKAEQPEDQQDHNDGPQHDISPFRAICAAGRFRMGV
jgi:hypothetical protein